MNRTAGRARAAWEHTVELPDGLYRYVWGGVVVGFVVSSGYVIRMAPWLASRFHLAEWRYRMTTATRVGP